MNKDSSKSTVKLVNIEKIVNMIPHRYPMLLIDKVEDLVLGESATGIKNVTANENFFTGHFPSKMVMPGVLMIESMAQTCAVLVIETLGKTAEGSLVYFMSVDGAKFRKPVIPGDQLKFRVEKIKNRAKVWKFQCKGYVEDELVSEAVISAIETFGDTSKLSDNSNLIPSASMIFITPSNFIIFCPADCPNFIVQKSPSLRLYLLIKLSLILPPYHILNNL